MLMLLLVVGIGVFSGASFSAGFPYEIGQIRTYEHETEMPFPEEKATGHYVLTVLREEKVADRDCRVIQEHYDPASLGAKRELFFDSDFNRIQEIVSQGTFEERIEFDPPISNPYAELEVGEERKTSHTLIVRGLPGGEERSRSPFTRAVKRLPDETVEVPAGIFVSCRKIMERTESESVNQGGTCKIITIREAWWDPKQGLVKEIYHNCICGPQGVVVREWTMTNALKSITGREETEPSEK
ncbi:MAG TPA: hypothetical protein PLQ35_02015 [bacterium]|nr:hypothetical protein [bacterium]HQL61047.1 hypothetical protein [bacterium]